MIAPNPNDFQHQAEMWIGVVSVVIGLLINAYWTNKTRWEQKRHEWEIEQLKARQDRQGAAIKEQTATVTQVALAVGPVKPKEEEAA